MVNFDKTQKIILSLMVSIPAMAWASIPTQVVPSTAPESAEVISPIVQTAVTEIKAVRSPVPDFDQDLNNLAVMESKSREDATRQSRLKAAFKTTARR